MTVGVLEPRDKLGQPFYRARFAGDDVTTGSDRGQVPHQSMLGSEVPNGRCMGKPST